MDRTIPVLAGAVSTVIFASSTLPMLVKAARTKDLSSYSLGNILLSNFGNLVHSVYVFHLPAGPIWALHAFHLLSTAMMLVWYVRYTGFPIPRRRLGLGGSPDATGAIEGLASWVQAARRITLGGDIVTSQLGEHRDDPGPMRVETVVIGAGRRYETHRPARQP